MQTIKPSNKAFAWILSPYREVFESGAIRRWLEAQAKSHQARYVCLSGHHAAFSMYEGVDFGRTLTKVRAASNYLYVEKRQEGIVFVHIKDGMLIEDRVLASEQSLKSSLSLVVGARKHSGTGSYDIDHFGLGGMASVLLLLDGVAGEKGSVTELSNSLFDSIELSALSDDQVFQFVEVETAVRDLTDTKTQKITVGVVGGVLALALIFTSGIFNWEQTVERLNLIDNYDQFTQVMLNDASFSARLAQDFRIHKLIKTELPDWSLYKVTHTAEAIEYRLLPQSHFASVANLTLFADNYGMVVVNDKNGIGLVAGLDRQQVFTSEAAIRRYDLESLTANIIDTASEVTPFATIRVNRTDRGQHWSGREMSILLNEASEHDLLRIAAVVDGHPTRYPSFFSACQSKGCSYEVSPQGMLKGTINFTIYGDSIGVSTNG